MKIKFSYTSVLEYICLTLSLILIFWLLSLFESISSNGVINNIATTIVYKLLNDIWTGFLIGLLFFPLYLIFLFIKKPIGIVTIKVIFSLIVLIQLCLVKYSLTTHINLGADFLGYSMSDIYITVSSSESISLIYFLPFILLPVLFLGIYYSLKKFFLGKEQRIFIGFFILIIIFSGLKLIITQSSDTIYQNKLYFLVSDIISFQNEKELTNTDNIFYKKEYPLIVPFENSKDVLAPFFEIHKEEKPNIVMIIVEGLGADFIDGNQYGGFTPYLDSLIPKSLYWENFVSNAGRTFGAAPSLLGSLPFGEKGFMELNPLPSHISLISILKSNEYTTSYYSGDESSFDRKINFLEYNNIDNVIDVNKFGPEYIKTQENSAGFSWGYPDAEIFKKTLQDLDGKKSPRLDIIMTLTTHEPFDFPLKNIYLTKVDNIINSNPSLASRKDQLNAYKDIFACLLYTDNSIKNFMEAYAKRPDYNKTIFIITGDHRLIPVEQKDKLCRFHVPLYIYSPMLKKTAKFKSISSHWDVTPSLVSFLMNNYKFNKLEKTAWMSQGLDTARQFRNIHKIELMRSKGTINDLIYKDYLYSDGELYKIKQNFDIYKVPEKNMLKTMSDSLNEFKRLNAYLTKKNKIFPASLNIYTKPVFEFSKDELLTIKTLTKDLDLDKTFLLARDFAFKKEYQKSRLLCNFILNQSPNYADVRILKGRTLAWEGKYEQAEIELLEAVKRNPFYSDGYLALMDLYKWSSQDTKAVKIAEKALRNKLNNPDISFKLAETFKRMSNLEKANIIIDSILKIYPENKDYLTFKNSLKK